MTTAKNEGGWINLWMVESLGGLFQEGGMSNISAGGWLPSSPQQGKPWPNQMSLYWKMKAPFWKMIPRKPKFWKLLSICFSISNVIFGCFMANLGALSREMPHSPDIDHIIFINFQRLLWALQWAPSCEPSHAFPIYWLKPYLHKIFKSHLWESNPLMISAARWNTAVKTVINY